MALSAPKPLLLDFDNGVKRINESNLEGVDIVQVSSWQDMKELMSEPEELKSYQSIIVDTIGKMMDFIIIYKCGDKQPGIQSWGGINQEFSWFTRQLSFLNKNIIFVAHRDTRREGEQTVFVPALREKSYTAIVTELDLLGYMEMRNINGRVKRTITFDPTNRNDGKNTCYMPAVMDIPTVLDRNGKATAKNDFIQSQVIAPYLNMLAVKQKERQEYDKLITEIELGVEQITDAQSAQFFSEHIGDYKHIGSSLSKARSLFAAKIKSLGITYDKESKTYVAA